MKSEIDKKGSYERFKTTEDHEILVLNDKHWFAVVEGQKGLILVKSDSDHEKDETIAKGKFYLADIEDDPDFNDVPHLFLEEDNDKFQEWILPNNLPSNKDEQKKLVQRDEKLSKKKVEKFVEKVEK